MSTFTEQQLKEFISQGKISIELDEIILDDTYITKKEFVASMKKLQTNDKEKFEREDFSEYRKQSQKNKNKIRKG